LSDSTQAGQLELLSPQTAAEFEHYYFFRWQQLRQPLACPQGSERDDLEHQAQHCMARINGRIIGVGRIHQDSDVAAQIRYVAVASDWRARGVGRAILDQLICHAEQYEVQYCWCNARDEAVIFYQRYGFKASAAVQTTLDIPHTRMEYYLD
tara:strand:+ start:126 stop:581 length:456 start_codon:yes stop_codon:yes gene_type:complete